jgi:transcription elongation factor GreA-like protein
MTILSKKNTSYEFKNADIISNGNNTKINIYKDDYFSLEQKIQSDIKSKNEFYNMVGFFSILRNFCIHTRAFKFQ